jgi:hypothetical protein
MCGVYYVRDDCYLILNIVTYCPPQTAVRASKRGHHFIGVVKTSHARFPKQCLLDNLKDKRA